MQCLAILLRWREKGQPSPPFRTITNSAENGQCGHPPASRHDVMGGTAATSVVLQTRTHRKTPRIAHAFWKGALCSKVGPSLWIPVWVTTRPVILVAAKSAEIWGRRLRGEPEKPGLDWRCEQMGKSPKRAFGIGGAEEDRTPDLRIANATLSQLSYRPKGPDCKGLDVRREDRLGPQRPPPDGPAITRDLPQPSRPKQLKTAALSILTQLVMPDTGLKCDWRTPTQA